MSEEIKNTENVETNEAPANHLANVHAGEVKTETETKEEVAVNHLAEVHAENPKSDAVVTNALNTDPNDVTNKGAESDELPTHLGGIKLENEE